MDIQNNQVVDLEQNNPENRSQSSKKGNFLLILIIFIIIALGLYGYFISSGDINLREYEVQEFQSIRLEVPGNLHLTQDEQQSVRIETTDNIFEYLSVDINDGKMVISSNNYLWFTRPIDIYVSMNEIENLTISGSGSITGQSMIITDSLKISIKGSGFFDLDLTTQNLQTIVQGSGRANLKGTTNTNSVIIEGSGSIHAFDFLTEITNVRISGSGSVEIITSKQLDIDITGSGVVLYKGTGTVAQKISGSGRVERR